jgi:uncharacterized membrane-anchored protein
MEQRLPAPGFAEHPARGRVVAELHQRRMSALVPPLRMVQLLRIVPAEARDAERDWLGAMPALAGSLVVEPRHASGRTGGGQEFIWERHSEASTASLILPGLEGDAFAPRPGESALVAWLFEAPGTVLRGVRIAVLADDAAAAPVVAAAGFAPDELVACDLAGRARMWSDYRVHGDGLGRLVVAANGMPPADLGRTVQRLQELGNYRNMTLLGFEAVQAEAATLSALEGRMTVAVTAVHDGADDQATLADLGAIAAGIGALTQRTLYRLGATEAYFAIVEDRLAMLEPVRVPGFQGLDDFTERRLVPAVRTCRSFAARVEALERRAERATSQLRTRIDMRIQDQNNDLLASMSRAATRQLRLQRLVEGLSVIAISYYAVSLFGYLAKGLARPMGMPADLLTALAAVPVVLLVWWFLRREIRRAEASEE